MLGLVHAHEHAHHPHRQRLGEDGLQIDDPVVPLRGVEGVQQLLGELLDLRPDRFQAAGVSACEVLVRSRRCSAPSTVNMERPASIMPISGHARVTAPLCHRPQASMSFTSLGSSRSCRASACRVTVQAGTPSRSIRARTPAVAQPCGLAVQVLDHGVDDDGPGAPVGRRGGSVRAVHNASPVVRTGVKRTGSAVVPRRKADGRMDQFGRGDGQFEIGQPVQQYLDAGTGDDLRDLLGGEGAAVLAVAERQVRAVAALPGADGGGGDLLPDVRVGVGRAEPEEQHVAPGDVLSAEPGVTCGPATSQDLGGAVLPEHLVHGLGDTMPAAGQGVGELVLGEHQPGGVADPVGGGQVAAWP